MPIEAMVLQALQTVAVFAVAAIGARIAWQQKEIAAERLKLDKFDKRFRVFDSVRAFLAHVTMSSEIDPAKEREFIIATLDARFLFDAQIASYVEGLRMRAIEFTALNWQLQQNNVDRGVVAERIMSARNAFNAELMELPDKFARFLELSRH